MREAELMPILEALLLSSDVPLSLEKMQAVFEEGQRPTTETLKKVLDQLRATYVARSFELVEVASGYRVQTKAEYAPWIACLHTEKPAKYSRALLETLAIIAYKQPVTRADIEEIRGVAVSSQMIKTLMEREWIRIAGYKEVAGKPAVFVTAKAFLNYFNMASLKELPTLKECVIE